MQKILDSLHLNKKDAYIALFTVVALGISFAIFNSTSVEKARAWDIKWGYFSILGTFVLLLAGIALNAKDFVRRVRGHLPCRRSLIVLGALLVFFSVFAVTHIQNTHRVLSDETSWESMALQMRYAHSGGICNEGTWGNDKLDCVTEVNNFKGKALGFVQSMTFYVAAPNRDTALKVNFPLYLLSLVAFFFALSVWFRNDWLALAATAFLGGMPIYLLQARSASTEVLYIALLSFLMAWYALVPTREVTWKHFFLTVPLLGFFAQTRQETVFAFIPFAIYYWRYFRGEVYRLPAFVLSVVALSWPAVNTMAAYRGYDFQGGEHSAHSIDNLIFNLKSNIHVMLNFETDPSFGGIMKNPFYSTFTIILLAATAWLLLQLIIKRKYWRGFVLGILFCIQIFVILVNVSGTFDIDINQRYVLVALPLFAIIMTLGFKDFVEVLVFPGNGEKSVHFTVIVAVLLSVGLAVIHVKSYTSNMLYYNNKLLIEEEFLNTYLKPYPKNAVFIYSRPWQMLASGHSAFSEQTFMNWTTDDFARWQKLSGGNIYLVRGQDGYGDVDRASRVVGFKTTSQIETILEGYKTQTMLQKSDLFGYPLTVVKIVSKRGVSLFEQNLFTGEVENGKIEIQKSFPDSVAFDVLLNGKPFAHNVVKDSTFKLSVPSEAGLSRFEFRYYTPDGDTAVVFRDFFKEAPSALLIQSLPMASWTQEWGEPQIGKSIDQHIMKLNGEPFRYGIGSHASSRLTYNLPGTYSALHADIGLDDESACGDGATFAVEGDGRELFRTQKMYSRDHQNISVNIAGVKRLELVVYEGENKDCDHADWADIWLSAGEAK